MCVISFCLSCQAASTDMHHNLLRSTCDLDLRSNIDLTLQDHHVYGSAHREDHDSARIFLLAFLVRKLFAKNVDADSYFAVFGSLMPEPLKLAQI